ncbi:MAG: hypothetical protein KF767_18510 [Bdellovibrionaceae bacterium]|nr:hypothetical protein [Pseudobdellovibrionaceae bacterium]
MKWRRTALIVMGLCMPLVTPLKLPAVEAMRVPDVETLNDDLSKYSGRRIQIDGKLEENIDKKSFVLSSGGIISDEIVVVGSPEDPTDLTTIPKNTKLTITGTLLLKPVSNVTKDGTWTLTPQITTGFREVKAFLIADEINRRE